MSDMNLDETLRALRESAANEAPSASLEPSLLREFRRHHRQKTRRQMWIGIGIGVAASLLIALALKPEHPPAAAKITPRVPVLSAPPQPVVAVAVQPQRRPLRVSHKPAAKLPQPTPEVATDFIPIPYAPDFHAEDSAAIVRMELPRYSLQTVGLPFNPERANERIGADVLMGQDGIARAIRFVH
jgi:hypothetical protein